MSASLWKSGESRWQVGNGDGGPKPKPAHLPGKGNDDRTVGRPIYMTPFPPGRVRVCACVCLPVKSALYIFTT